MQTKESTNPPLYFRHPDLPMYSVRWPHGGWIVWEWNSPSWDHVTDERREELKTEERAAFGIQEKGVAA